MESSKTSRGKHGDQTSDFSKIWCGVGLQNPNGSKSQTGQASHRELTPSICRIAILQKKLIRFSRRVFAQLAKKWYSAT
jgi:hypothetical protein